MATWLRVSSFFPPVLAVSAGRGQDLAVLRSVGRLGASPCAGPVAYATQTLGSCCPGPGPKRDAGPALISIINCCCRYEAALQKANEAAAALRPGVKRDPEPKEEVIGDDDDDEDLQVCTCRGCV